MSVKITYFVHGTTVDNEHDLATGWNDGELSDIGKERAAALGKLTETETYDAVFCSDLKRAVDSAKLAFGQKYNIIKDSRLREINYGDYNGKPSSLFKNDLPKYIFSSFSNGESYHEVESRMAEFCNFLKNNYNDKRVAIVSHQAPQLALDVIVRKKSWPQAIAEDWRNFKLWQPGWHYEIKD